MQCIIGNVRSINPEMSHVCIGLYNFEMNVANSRTGGYQDILLCEVEETDSYKLLRRSKGLGQSGSRDMAAKNVREVPVLEGYADETVARAINVINH